jgi:4-aminobutyrate aminotransferase
MSATVAPPHVAGKENSQSKRQVKILTPVPGPKAREIMERDAKYIMTSTKSGPVVAEKGEGVVITDVDGNTFLDFAAGVGVLNTGHCHPDVVQAVKKQTDRLMHFAGTDFYYDVQATLAERLAKSAPGTDAKKVFFTNSGAESVEAALKMARWDTGRSITLGLIGAFHGRTMGALTMTASRPVQRRKFNAFVGGGTHIPAPYCYRCPYKMEYPSCGLYCIKILDELYFNSVLPPEDVAAFIAEPVMGEGGYVVPPKDYLATAQKILKPHGILHIDDEVQAGMGRTGKMWAVEHFGVVPDILTTAKALGSGIPIGAAIFDAKLDYTVQGAHSNTFGGNLVACAAANATLDIMDREKLLANASKQGAYLKKRMEELMVKYVQIGDVRGLGLMVATEFVKDRRTKEPATAFRDAVEQEAYRRGLILLGCGKSAIRYIPPLIVQESQIDEAVEILEASMNAVLKSGG